MLYLQHFTHIIISYSTKSPPDVVHFVSAENALEAASSPETKFNASSQRTEGMTEIHEGIVKVDAVINKSWVNVAYERVLIFVHVVMMIWFLSVIYAYHIHIHRDISTSD